MGEAPTHRHVKSGTEYVLIGYGKLRSKDWLTGAKLLEETNVTPSIERTYADNAKVAVYRSVDDNTLWVRPLEEFEDGRFKALPP